MTPNDNLFEVGIDEIDVRNSRGCDEIAQSLARDGALIIHVPGFDRSHGASMAFSKEFFDQPLEDKQRCVHKNKIDSTIELSFDFEGRTIRKSMGDVLSGERGWIGVGSSRTGCNKEYFQYGEEYWWIHEGQRYEIVNAWPSQDRWHKFVHTKKAHLALFRSIHSAMFKLLDHFYFSEPGREEYSKEENIICRETHSLSEAASSKLVVRNTAHVDLSEGTAIKVEPGLQLYRGDHWQPHMIEADERGWTNVDPSTITPDGVLYIVGLASEIRSGGKLRAAWHRVVGLPNEKQLSSRYSIVSFGNAGVNDYLAPPVGVPGYVYPKIERGLLPVVGNRSYYSNVLRP